MAGPIDVEGFNSDTRDNSINLGSSEDETDNEPLIVTSMFRYEEKQLPKAKSSTKAASADLP